MSASEPLGSVFESFYTRHLLRDVLAKMAARSSSLALGSRSGQRIKQSRT